MLAETALILLICATLIFLFVIHSLAPRLRKVFPPLPIWRGVLWYRWRSLPSPQALAFSPFTGISFPYSLQLRAKSAWIFFTLHFIFMTSMVLWSQNKHSTTDSHNCPQPASPDWCGWSTHLDTINCVTIIGNILFAILRIVQTHIWYDGLAHDVSEVTSMGAVFIVVAIAILMQQTERGIVFGYSLQSETFILLTNIMRRFHGYIFVWGILFVFWYHPVETGGAHLSGFFITILFLIQGCLMFTTSHLNILWRTILECSIIFHAVVVELPRTHRDSWRMFVSGGLATFIISQMHAFPVSFLTKSALATLCSTFVFYLYRDTKGRWKETSRIPMSYYLFIIIFYFILYITYMLVSVLAYWPESTTAGTLPGGFHAPLVVCAVVLVLAFIAVIMLVAELFENILRSLSSKAGPASGKVKSLLEDPEKKIDIEIRKLPKITMDEVLKHDQEKDCWVVIHGVVYDVTDFLLFHPGGKVMLLKHCGTDGSHAFDGINANTGHPKVIRERMRTFACGFLEKD